MFLPKAVHVVHFMIVTSFATTNYENTTLRDRIPIYLQELCPGSGACLNDVINDVIDPAEEGFSCCGTCSCSVDCEVKGNCCFQNQTRSSIDHSTMSTLSYKECLYPSTMPQNEAFQKSAYQSYYMISSSPEDADSKERANISATCGDVRVAPWGSMLPVYSKQTGKFYKNRVCADAFNVTDGKEWSAYLSCEHPNDRYDGASFVSGLQNGFLPDYCFVKFIFEGEVALLRSHICYKSEDFKKPECLPDFRIPEFTTASRDDIVAACKSDLVSPYYTFINIFCRVCKNMQLMKAGSQCSSDSSSRTTSFSTSFASVIDTNVYSQKPNGDFVKYRNIQTACPVDTFAQVNKYMKTGIACRAISCPSGQIFNQDNRCTYPGKKWFMDDVFIPILLTLDKNINIELISDPLKNFQSPWPKSWTIDVIYSVDTAIESQTSSFFVLQHVTFHSPFNPKYLLHNIQKFINKPWLLKTNNETIKLTAKLPRFKSLNAANVLSTTEFKRVYKPMKFLRIKTIITELYFCDHVTLSPTEYSLHALYPFIFNKITNKTLLDGEFTIVENRAGAAVEVCLEKSGFSRISLNESPRIWPHHLLMQSLVTVLVILF